MASWFRRFLLKAIHSVAFTVIVFSSVNINAEEQTAPLQIQTEQLIQPEIERRTVILDKIDTEDFEATAFMGVLSIEDFGANAVMGIRLAYHLNEDIFIEGSLAKSKAGQTSYERLSGGTPLLTAAQREVLYYNVSIGYNLLPGESFLTRNTSFNSTVYLIAGVGNTTFAGSDKLTINMGGGFRLLATDWLALHIDVRNHIFNIDILAEDKTANNLEVTFGLSAFF
ncbi:MAG: outer membrane beta-barrel domain-containing protein [Gammaproteobacteria bacterium]|nr:outer membrane beta-barrel domain-containing protein [Gammaproteobacteria bacterium]MCW8988817.1 outer membrane beta-barrel domain-containing protein [Gammaproteobacteria bacterium]